ncbi:hypothetical protein EDC04DRAFT_2619114 [Pisolithus marmoratus]|nr:hypothetical protein EDC04DRAFT_2619114 [Pisolithus marmoratus]
MEKLPNPPRLRLQLMNALLSWLCIPRKELARTRQEGWNDRHIELVGEGNESLEGLYPKAYVGAMLEVHGQNSDTVTQWFRGEAGFVASLDRACREFLDWNPASGTSTTKSPDMLLRKGNKMAEEEDLEGAPSAVSPTSLLPT